MAALAIEDDQVESLLSEKRAEREKHLLAKRAIRPPGVHVQQVVGDIASNNPKPAQQRDMVVP